MMPSPALPITEQIWQAGCGRITEAFLDTYHFAFTHWGSLGDPSRPEAPKAAVTMDGNGFHMEYSSRQPNTGAVNYGATLTDTSGGPVPEFVVSRYQGWAVPNAVYLLKTTGPVRFGILVAVCPLGPRLSKLYRILYASRDWQVDHRELAANQDRINQEDREIVETARPWELSTDLDAELQTYMDRPTVTYRKWLATMNVHFM